jgi:hypothetical protein
MSVEQAEQQAAIAPNKIYRAARAIVLVALAATVITGLLHTKVAKPLLMKLGGCPAGFANREDVDKIRKYGATFSSSPEAMAPAKPALGFVLDSTTEDDFGAWVKKNNLKCEENARLGQMTCTGVPSALVGEPESASIDDLTVAFSPAHKVVNILVLRHNLKSEPSVTMFETRVASLEKALGPSSIKRMPDSPTYFSQEALTTANVEYKYKDYGVEVSATTMMDMTVTFREHYYSTL